LLVMRKTLLMAAVGAAAIVTVVWLASRASTGGTTRAVATAGPSAKKAAVTPRANVRATTPGLALRATTPGVLPDAAPGAVAFRGYTDDYVDAQPAIARDHMAREKITMEETRELTYFAVLAVESQDWARVESLTGRPLGNDQRREVWESMMARSQEMRRHMGEAIANGADEGARWETIGRVEGGYLEDYYRITGMTPALLDQLLLASVRDQRVNQTLASLSPSNNEPPPMPAGRSGTWVKRDPLHPERPPVPVEGPPPP
jgi:hypothetical protein